LIQIQPKPQLKLNKKNDQQSEEAEWVEVRHESGEKFYYNLKSKKSQRKKPDWYIPVEAHESKLVTFLRTDRTTVNPYAKPSKKF